MSDEREQDEQLHSGRFSIIPAVALDDPRMTPALLKLLCVLGTYGDRQGYCWPKRETLARRLGGISKPAISQGIRKLKELGYLEVTARYGRDGAQKGNCYRILFDTLPEYPSELTRELAPEITPHKALEVTPLTSHYERPNDLSSSAAAKHYRGTDLTPTTPEAAAAEGDNDLNQTAEAVRRHLRMGRDKLPGLKLIVAQYPGARAWLENQANLCFETLKVRPLQLNHFSNWLDEYERRRNAPREELTREQPTNTTHATHATTPETASSERGPDERTAAEIEQSNAELNAYLAALLRKSASG